MKKTLLEAKEDEEDAGADEQANCLVTGPAEYDTAKGERHDSGYEASDLEDSAGPVDFDNTRSEAGFRAGIARGKVEEVDGSEEGPDNGIDVGSPSPGSAAVGESSTNNGAETRAT